MGITEYRHTSRLHMMGVTVYQNMAATAADWWDIAGETCVAAYQAKGAASLAASYVNLANPGTYDINVLAVPSWTAGTGWAGNSWQMRTDVNVESSWTLIARFSDHINSIGNYGIMGASVYHYAAPYYYGLAYYRNSNGGIQTLDAGAGQLSGVIAIAGKAGYMDGASKGTVPGAYYAGSITNWYWGISFAPCDVTMQACAIYSTTLDATQVATLSASMAAL